MTDWRETTTAALVQQGVLEIGDGYRAKNSEFVEKGGLPFVRVGDVSTSIRLEGLDELPRDRAAMYGRKISQPYDSLITMKGTVGRVAYVSPDHRPFVFSPQISYWRSRDPQQVNPRWLRYWLESPQFLAQALATKGATDMADYINLRDQRRMRISLPPPVAQTRIAGVLAALDDLIENNRRRIEVLEQMAQAIYREWFVHFRYPGHQDVPLVDSPLGPIPDCWGVKPFTEIASFVNGFAFKPMHWGTIGRPIIKIKQLKEGVAASTPRCDDSTIDSKYWVEAGDLLFSWSADLGVYRWSGAPGLLNQHLFVVAPTGQLPISFLYHSLADAMPQFWKRAQGTTMRHIKRAALTQVSAVVPHRQVVEAFDVAAEPMAQEVIRLRRGMHWLSALRDLLLPKLVTGELDVSGLNLDALVEASA